ncbi:MAG: type 4b pilus protein PilO2 [Proteobacteria bacterium]|nr:type 4b pilus protein PilO2 [Pseudomonadota bacterium]
MQSQVIVVSRKKYASSLFWQPVAVGQNTRGYAASLAKTVDKKLNLFVEYRSMIGMGARKLGHRAGMAVAAAEIMESFAEYSSFLAAFAIPNGFWVVGARNGIIIADKLYETEAEAKGEYAKIATLPDWGTLIAPNDWRMPRAIEKVLEDLISGDTKITLKAVSNFKGNAFALVLFAAFIFGLFYFFREPLLRVVAPRPQLAKVDRKLAEEYKRKLAEKNAEINAAFNPPAPVAAPAPEPIKMPFDSLPDKYARADICWRAIGFLMQPIPGWVQLSADCNVDAAEARFRRGYGTLADLHAVADQLMPGAQIAEMSDSDAIISVRLPRLDTFSSLEEMDADSVVRDINSMFQLIGTEGDVRTATEEIMRGAEAARINTVLVSAKSKLTPREFIKIFDAFSGVSIPKISWDSRARIWNYEVKIYVK